MLLSLHCPLLILQIFYPLRLIQLLKAIKIIANENIRQIKHWADKHPDCTKSSSRKNDLYLKIVSNSMNGLTEEEGRKNINKIISNVAKQTVIQKN